MDATGFFQHLVVANPRNVARLIFAELFQDLECRWWRTPLRKHRTATPVMRDQLEDVKVGQRLARGARDFLDESNAALGINKGAFLFAPTRGGQNQVGLPRRLGAVIQVLHHEKLQLAQPLVEAILVDPRM